MIRTKAWYTESSMFDATGLVSYDVLTLLAEV